VALLENRAFVHTSALSFTPLPLPSPQVQSLVTSGFIFWQQNSELSEAVTFIERYKVASYPHLSILDPRTGRQIWSKEGWTMESPVTAETFLEYVMDFGDKHSFDKPPAAPPAPAPSQSSSSSKSASPPPSNKRPITDLSEEEQLKAAMAASMQVSGRGSEPFVLALTNALLKTRCSQRAAHGAFRAARPEHVRCSHHHTSF